MSRVVVTGLGFVSSIGNSLQAVEDSLRGLKHGYAPFPAKEGEVCPPKLYGRLADFDTESWDSEEWSYPTRYKVARSHLKGMSRHVLYAYFSTLDAIADAGLELSQVSDHRTGIYSASAGAPGMAHHQVELMNKRGVLRCSPFGVVATTVGTLNFNLGAILIASANACEGSKDGEIFSNFDTN